MTKIAILYYSRSKITEKIANLISDGAKEIEGIESRTMKIDEIDYEYIKESKAVIFGTPTYYANISWQMKKWFDESWLCNLEGKIGAGFATADYIGGGGDTAVLTLINHMMVKGMLVYSGGSALGEPYLHLGLVVIKNENGNQEMKVKEFGKRIARKAMELFEN